MQNMYKLLSFKNNNFLFKLVEYKNVHTIRNFASTSSRIIKSKIDDIYIPNISLEEYIWKGLDKWHHKIATVCSETGRSYLYSDIYKNSKALRNVLGSFPNLKQNDTVAIILPNIPEYPIIMLGAIEAGLKVTTLNPIYTTDEIYKQLQDSDAKIIFTLSDYCPKIDKATEKCNFHIPTVVVKHLNDEIIPAGALHYDELIEKGKNMNFNHNIKRNFEDVIILPYSSGTTGVPKGVELTNKGIVSNLYQMNAQGFKMFNDAEGNHQEIVPLLSPIFHLYGMVVIMLNMLSAGCKLVTIPKFGSSSFVEVLNDFRPTFAYVTPPTVLFLLNNENVRSEHISRIKTIVSAAAPLGALDVDKLKEKSKNQTNILQLYGLTEASPITHHQTTHIENGIKHGGCGFTVPNTECKIISVENNETILGPKETGELLIRGPQIMKGYRNNVKSTQDIIDAEGWLRTGDIAYYDENEHFYITDRLKELIKVKGYQVAPAELEELLRSHPSIQDAAVVGVPHDRFGEVPKAFIVTKENTRIDLPNIKKFIDIKVANYKQLTGGIVQVDSIPKNASGKILRRVLKTL